MIAQRSGWGRSCIDVLPSDHTSPPDFACGSASLPMKGRENALK